MIWNYRIIKHDEKKLPYYAVHEVYYDDKGKVEMWTAEPIDLVRASKADILGDIKHMLVDLKKPVLVNSVLEARKTKKVG